MREKEVTKGVFVEESARWIAQEEASVLRSVASEVATHLMGQRWRSPARDRAQARGEELEFSVLARARDLEIWAQHADSASVGSPGI